MNSERADILIRDAAILPAADPSSYIPQGWVSIQDSAITGIGAGAPPPLCVQTILDGRGCLAMPGLVNGHTHAAMSLFRGLADDLPLKSWFEEHIFPAEGRWLNEAFVHDGTGLACAEMIRSGTTTFADGYFFMDQVAAAVRQSGMRAVLCQGVLDFPTPESPSPRAALKRLEALIDGLSGSELIRPAIFPHSAYTCSPELYRECAEFADRRGIPLFTHLAESQSEVDEVIRRFGKRPVEHLEELGLLSPALIASHCVCLTEAEIDLLARREVKVVHTPESNMKLACGVAPIPDLLSRGVTVALGTDGCASNNNLDLFQEMDTAAKLHKVHRLDPTVMPASVVLEMATMGGAKVLGLEKKIGSIAPGKYADIILLDLRRPHLQPLYQIVSQLVYAAGGADVRDVIIHGRLVMRDRVLLTLDEESILARAREWRMKIAPAKP